MIRIIVAALFVLHGLAHLMGFAEAFGYADLPQLSQPISDPMGLLWLAAALLCFAAAAALFLAPRRWWVVGAVTVVTSQAVIVSSWGDAKFGTIATLMLLVAVLYGFASRGPLSLRAEYERDQQYTIRALSTPALLPQAAWSDQVVTEADIAPLPDPVRRYVRRSGVVGQPQVHDFRAAWTGRIRSGPTSQWMPFRAEQFNTFDTPRRFFLMDATMNHLPVDVLHAFDEDGASMRVKLLSAIPMVNAKGAELTRTETVTMFNDICFFAPGVLVSPAVTWESIDEHTARAHFTLGVNTIAAELHFNDAAELVDFISDDRSASSPDGRTFTPQRWATPARDYAQVGPARVATKADATWQPSSGTWTYGEFELNSLAYDVAGAR
jgi:uncharacterized membrane protein YphA (DoxX/SURF4 family)